MIENNYNKDLERKIDLYINGGLSRDEVDDLWAELVQNEYYLDYMKTVVNVKAVIDRQKTAKPASRVYKLKTYMKYVSAAAVLIVAGVIGIVNYNGSNNLGIEPVADIGLDVVRSADGVSDDVTNEVIKKAIQLATSGNVEEAMSLLKEELNTTEKPKEVAEIALSLGSIQYNYGEYESALESFNLIIKQEGIDNLTLEKGYWFLGNTYFQLDRLEFAEEAFQNAYDLNGAYSRIAKTYVEALKKVAS
ncbi:MAG: hypothetical protein FH748_08910 [Balneolaceae bacterium]|nr:hypothetical protein [Balneolaceae bacterium]